MSAPMISQADAVAAGELARGIGRTLRKSREQRGLTQCEAARKMGMRVERMRVLEAGAEENVKLGTLVKWLRLYGLSLVVVRDEVPS